MGNVFNESVMSLFYRPAKALKMRYGSLRSNEGRQEGSKVRVGKFSSNIYLLLENNIRS